MTEATENRTPIDRPSDEQTPAKREWQAPTLTVLGDVHTMTEAGGNSDDPDGDGFLVS